MANKTHIMKNSTEKNGELLRAGPRDKSTSLAVLMDGYALQYEGLSAEDRAAGICILKSFKDLSHC